MKKVIIISLLLVYHLVIAQNKIDNQLFVLIKRENYDQAISYANKKLEYYKTNTWRYERKATSILLGLGLVYEKIGDLKEAENNYRACRDIYESRINKGRKARYIDLDAADELASLNIKLGNYKEAEKILVENIAIRSRRFTQGNPIRYRSYLPYGMLLIKQKNYDQAFEYLKDYVLYIKNSNHTSKYEISRLANTYDILADLELERDTAKALEFAKKAERFQRHLWTFRESGKNTVKRIESLNKLAKIQLLNEQLEEAAITARKAAKLYRRSFGDIDNIYKISIYENKARIALLSNDTDRAILKADSAAMLQLDNIEHNFNYLSEYEKENLYTSIKSTFELYNSILMYRIDHGISGNELWIQKFMQYQSATKGLIINHSNAVINELNADTNSVKQKLYKKLIRLKNDYANAISVNENVQLNEHINTLEIEINNLEKEIRNIVDLEPQQQITITDIQSVLAHDEFYVEIVRCSDFKTHEPKYLLLGISDTTFKLTSMGAENLEGRNLNYYVNARTLRLTDKVSYDVYVKPLMSLIEHDFSKINISPDGAFNLININNILNPRTNQYVIDAVQVVNLTSTQSLFDKPESKSPIESMALFGNPVFDTENKVSKERGLRSLVRGDVANLPGTGIEVAEINKIALENNVSTTLFTLLQATEHELKSLQSPNALHIATHGFFDADLTYGNAMMHSGILFTELSSDLSKEDGVFTSYEASCLDLKNTKLVVLSACETGKGDLRFGEGVYGLQRSFIVAGVDNIIMSMWKVDDDATKELMISFYRNLFSGEEIHTAFTKAQYDLRKKYPEPYYWGAFKLLGN